ncbi:hypothetical protein L1987_55459 [Smallanthus sonchifolius]|uniref:Uncharacterized protein n=1 Tax=Smallanthus sonchifolius TaxID=185202 RepID=A0ACB9E9N2_9ASTR|nr:hypothetical protein L1987_55459 [Smallanthus sonchifolius]
MLCGVVSTMMVDNNIEEGRDSGGIEEDEHALSSYCPSSQILTVWFQDLSSGRNSIVVRSDVFLIESDNTCFVNLCVT